MARHTSTRWLAPLALLATVVAVGVVVTASTGDGDGTREAPGAAKPSRTSTTAGGAGRRDGSRTSTSPSTSTSSSRPAGRRRDYTVRPGDTFASIAERTQTSVEELEELNPGVDSQSLAVGQRVRTAR